MDQIMISERGAPAMSSRTFLVSGIINYQSEIFFERVFKRTFKTIDVNPSDL